jgi:DnaB-like helicase N terminal domain
VDSQRIAAERALLGAVLLDPAGQQHVLDFVEADDFLRPWHAQVHAAMGRLRRAGRLPGAREVYAELRNDLDLPAEVALDGVLLADLMAAAPRQSHAPAYAAAVVECGIRQRVWIAGSRVRQAAGSGDVRYALDQAGEAGREVAAGRDRWERLPGTWRRELPQPAADVLTAPSGVVRPSGRDADAAGLRVLRELAAGPGQISGVGRWLRPEHFAGQREGQVYALMQDMAAAGIPVDPVTVSREAARSGVPAGQAELAGGTGVFAHAAARDLYGRAVLAQIGHAGAGVQAAAAGPRGTVLALLDAAAERLDDRDGRWHPEPWRCPELRRLRVPVPVVAAPAPGLPAAPVTPGASQHRQPELDREAVS